MFYLIGKQLQAQICQPQKALKNLLIFLLYYLLDRQIFDSGSTILKLSVSTSVSNSEYEPFK